MRYTKPWLSYEQQADRLISRGLLCDRQELVERLIDVGYYRLSGYLYIFKSDPTGGDESFVSGTSLAKVWDLYTFDRQLRLVTLDAIERVEVYMRTQLAYLLAEASGPFGYLNRPTLPNMDNDTYDKFISRCTEAYDRSHTLFINHFKHKYGDTHGLPPYWILVNIMDFGMMLSLFRGSPDDVKKSIASELGIPPVVLESWLLTLNTVRNVCAHHDRLWNRRLGNRIKIPRRRRYPEWHDPYEVPNCNACGLLTVLSYLLERIAPGTSWHAKVGALLSAREEDDLRRMGFDEGWEACPLWARWITTPTSA